MTEAELGMQSQPGLPSPLPPEARTESLSAQFERLCAAGKPQPVTNEPALPTLTREEARFLTRNADGEVYMTPEAVADATGKHRPEVLSAFRKALVHAFGDDPSAAAAAAVIDASANTSADSITLPENSAQDAERKRSDCSEAASMTFAQLVGIDDFVPRQELATFSWSASHAKTTLDNFNAKLEAEREARRAEEAVEAKRAMERAAAAGARTTHPTRQQAQADADRQQNITLDPVVWAAQEDAAASSVLREIRTGLSKMRKGSSRAPPDGSPVWTLLAHKSSRLKPEAAAEMARAKIAAAAAAAAMREDDPQLVPGDSLADIEGNLNSHEKSADQSGQHALRHSLPGRLFEPRDAVFSQGPGFPRTLSIDSRFRLQNVPKKKRVGFAADTVFDK